ncbi:MAG: P-II family nitrogen regulator [Ruminococcus sp.]
MELSRIEIITGMSKFNGLKSALSKAGVRGMTVTQVLGCGIEKGTKEYEVDENYEMELLPKQQIAVGCREVQGAGDRGADQTGALYRTYW